jgi:hypothetical protein
MLSLRAGPRADHDPKFPAKVLLTELGARLGARTIYNLNGCFNYLFAGWWFRSRGFLGGTLVASRFDVFDLVLAEVAHQRVLYLEFGVAAGNSMRYWSNLLRNPHSQLHGFDSFRGLPHDWILEGHPRGYFSTQGVIPQINDPRVEFSPGCSRRLCRRTNCPNTTSLLLFWMQISTRRRLQPSRSSRVA